MHTAIWIIAALLLALWSLLAWGLAAVLGLDPSWAADLRPLVDKLPFAEWLDRWIPGWQVALIAMIDLAHALLGWLGGAARWIVWAVWGAGAFVIVATGAALSLFVRLVDKVPTPPASPPSPPSAPPPAQSTRPAR
jgi:hypothetical protein